MVGSLQPYPVNLSIDYPEGPRKKVTVLFRIFAAIPIILVLTLLAGGGAYNASKDDWSLLGGAGIILLPTLLMILFRQKYPAWWFAFNLHLTKFSQRAGAYILLLRDEYPSTDAEQAVHVQITYPDAQKDLKRWYPLVKWLLAVPHYFVLLLLSIVVVIVTIIAWFAILFKGHYPRNMFNFVVGVERWSLRVEAYAFLLTTDIYPPFRLDP